MRKIIQLILCVKRLNRASLLYLFCIVILGISQAFVLYSYYQVPPAVTAGKQAPKIIYTAEKSQPHEAASLTVEPPVNSVLNETQMPEYGIAAGGGLDNLNQTDLNKYFAKLKGLGAEWVRWDIDWSAIQSKSSKEYNWQGADRVANTAQSFGIKSLGIITYTPKWARLSSCNDSNKCRPDNASSFGKFAGEVALRYKDKIDHFEIWNEPNYHGFWLPTPNVSDYQNILKSSYVQIKAANPNTVVLSGGMAAIGDENGNVSPITFISQLYALKSNEFLDAVSLHPYSYPALPAYSASWNRWQQIVPIHEMMAANGDINKKIWLTEYGAPTNGSSVGHTTLQLNNYVYDHDYMTEEAQNDLLVSAITEYKTYSAWTGPFFYYSLQDAGTSTDTTENFYGLLRYDNSRKQAYFTFEKAIKHPSD